jgi:hypothetical protein
MGEESKAVILATLAFVRIRETLVFCGRNTRPSDGDWDVWLKRIAVPDFKLLLIVVDSEGPDAKQRGLVAELWKKSGRALPKTAMVSSSAIARSMITAFQWLLGGSEIKTFTPKEIGDALQWLGASATLDEASRALVTLRAEKREGARA